MLEIGASGSMSGEGNRALAHGPSYRASPQLYVKIFSYLARTFLK